MERYTTRRALIYPQINGYHTQSTLMQPILAFSLSALLTYLLGHLTVLLLSTLTFFLSESRIIILLLSEILSSTAVIITSTNYCNSSTCVVYPLANSFFFTSLSLSLSSQLRTSMTTLRASLA